MNFWKPALFVSISFVGAFTGQIEEDRTPQSCFEIGGESGFSGRE